MAKRAANEASKPTAKLAPQKAASPPLSDADLAKVAGGYIGETEKNLPRKS